MVVADGLAVAIIVMAYPNMGYPRPAQGSLRQGRGTSRFRPVLDFQSGHASEFPLIVCDQGELGSLGMRGDPQIVVPDHLTAGF